MLLSDCEPESLPQQTQKHFRRKSIQHVIQDETLKRDSILPAFMPLVAAVSVTTVGG